LKEQILAVQRMQDYIEQNNAEEISLSELARASLFSPWYAYRLFRDALGLTPAEYIRKYRLTQAARRLRSGEVKVIDAALDAGFSNVDTFTRAFYREFGLKPSDYMKKPIPVTFFIPYGAKYRELRKENIDVSNIQPIFIQVVRKPERLCIIKRGTHAEDYSPYDGAGYTFLEQSFGAVSAVAICASGLMGLPLAVSGLRELKILKRFRVTPVSPMFVLGVELSMYVVYCAVSLATLWAAALLWGVRLHGSLLAFLGSWVLTMLSTLSVGMLVGGVAKDSKQVSIISSILYFPMLIFSGTTLPLEVMPAVMRRMVGFFPLTQGLTMMKSAFLGANMGNILLPMGVMVGVIALCTALSVRFFRWE